MITLPEYISSQIFEATTLKSDYDKHGYKYLKNFIRLLSDDNTVKIKLGSGGNEYANVNPENRQKFFDEINKILKTNDGKDVHLPQELDKLDDVDFSKMSIDDFNNAITSSNVAQKEKDGKPIRWQGIYKEVVKDESGGLSAADMEVITALSINSHIKDDKYASFDRIEDKVRFIAGVSGDKPLTDKQRLICRYYKDNQKRLDKVGKSICDSLEPKPTTSLIKQPNLQKQDKSEQWMSDDRTPKTDLISSDGENTYSLKKYPSSQLMSGGQKETVSTLMSLKNSNMLSDEDKKTLDKVIKTVDQDNLWEMDGDTKKNRDKINQAMGKVWKNEKLCYLFVRESITGEQKFKNKAAQAKQVIVFDEYNPEHCSVEEADDLAKTVSHMITHGGMRPIINTKSSNKHQWTVCRLTINSPKVSQYAKDHNTKDYMVHDEEGNMLTKEEIVDKDGKKKKVTIHTGPLGGRFYYPEPTDKEKKVYV